MIDPQLTFPKYNVDNGVRARLGPAEVRFSCGYFRHDCNRLMSAFRFYRINGIRWKFLERCFLDTSAQVVVGAEVSWDASGLPVLLGSVFPSFCLCVGSLPIACLIVSSATVLLVFGRISASPRILLANIRHGCCLWIFDVFLGVLVLHTSISVIFSSSSLG